MESQCDALRDAFVNAAPKIILFLAISVTGYYYAKTWLWLIVFVFGAVAVLINQRYYQKTMDLRDRLQNR